MELQTDGLVLRSWRAGDEEALVRYGDNPKIGANMAAAWPDPYTLEDARKWVESCLLEARQATRLVIEVDAELAGAIGYDFIDEHHPFAVEFGYWLGEPFWGRGLATAAVRRLTRHLFEDWGVVRMQAKVFDWNPASMRVLQKAGFAREAHLRKCAMKNGRIVDMVQYVLLNE